MDSNYMITSSGIFINVDELYHHGIKGQRWGIRRYQNPDGSLTEKGRKRYTNPDGTLNKKGQKKFGNSVKTDDVPKRKTARDMTDAELDYAITRARKEDEYNRLRPQLTADTKVSSVKKFLNDSVAPAAAKAGKDLVAGMMDKAVKDLLKGKVDPNSYEALKKTYDKLKVMKDIEDLKNPKNKELSWDDKLKKQQYEQNERNNAATNAERQAKKDAEQAKKDAKQARDRANYDYYNKPYTEWPKQGSSERYRRSGGERTYVNPNENHSLAVYNAPVSSISTHTVSTGMSAVKNYSNRTYQELIDNSTGNVITSWYVEDDN